mgnify:CR=1 FL=1|jgi:peptidyl-prolyl cis-trans isomerase C
MDRLALFIAITALALVSIVQGDHFKTNHRHAHAHHILVKTKGECEDLKTKIAAGEDFALMAKTHSLCPSGKRGGDLGTFGPGQMVEPFDKVVFNEEVGKVHGCVKTQFGHHLILIKDRDDVGHGDGNSLAGIGGHAHLAQEALKDV